MQNEHKSTVMMCSYWLEKVQLWQVQEFVSLIFHWVSKKSIIKVTELSLHPVSLYYYYFFQAAHIEEMSKEIAKAHEADKANRKTKKAKKSKPAQESAAPIEIEDESWFDSERSF